MIAVRWETPGMVRTRFTDGLKRGDHVVQPLVEVGDRGVEDVDVGQHLSHQ